MLVDMPNALSPQETLKAVFSVSGGDKALNMASL